MIILRKGCKRSDHGQTLMNGVLPTQQNSMYFVVHMRHLQTDFRFAPLNPIKPGHFEICQTGGGGGGGKSTHVL